MKILTEKLKTYLYIVFHIKIAHLLFPIFFLLFFQFFGSVVSLFINNLGEMIFLSFLLSTFTSLWISQNIKERIEISVWQLITILSLSFIVCLLFLFRINWHIYDYICPTGLLGLVTQVSNGIFPVSFLSFPDFPMNYHQGFIYLSGVVSYLFNIAPSLSIQATFIGLFMIMNVLIMIYFLSYKNKYFFLLPFLFVLISSISTKHFLGLDLNLYNYLNIFEQSSSSSWPLAFIGVITLLFIFKNYTHKPKYIFSLFLIVLSFSTINATFFSILVLAVPLLFVYKIYCLGRIEYKYLALSLALFLLIIIIPRYIPSAFLTGTMYENPQYGLRFFETETFKYFKHVTRYLLLSGPIVLLGLFLSYNIYKRKIIDGLTVLSGILLISFFFPIVFIFKNIDMWDNLHKFALINIFISILLVIHFSTKKIFKFSVIKFVFICMILSIPATYDMVKNRMSAELGNFIYPDKEIQDVVTYLDGKNKILIPYKIDIGGLCDTTGYAAIAQYSGNFLKYSYFDNFLLSKEIELDTRLQANWANSTSTALAELSSGGG